MSKNKFVLVGAIVLFAASFPAFGATTSLNDLQDLPKATAPVVDSSKVFPSNHWAYKTLQDISTRYGLAMGKPGDKFDGSTPISRRDAAIILVNLTGKIEQDKINVSEAEKAEISILRQELKSEMDELTGRIANVETSVKSLQGRVSNLENSDSKNFKYDFGKNFKINGDLQAQYIGKIVKGDEDYPTNFGIPYSEIYVSGNPTPKTEYMVNISPTNFFNTTTNGVLYDAYVAFDQIPHHKIYFGQTQEPIGQEGPQSILTKETIDKSQFTRTFSDRYDIGVKLAGSWDLVDYYLGAYNGNGMNLRDTNRGLDLASWVSLKPLYKFPQLGKLELGGGYFIGKDNEDSLNGATDVSRNIWGFYGSYKYKKYGIRSEYSRLAHHSIETADGLIGGASGFYVLNTYDLTKKLQLVARYDRFDPNRDVKKDISTEYTIGTNYFLTDSIMFRLNYVLVDAQSAKNDQRIGVMTQYMF